MREPASETEFPVGDHGSIFGSETMTSRGLVDDGRVGGEMSGRNSVSAGGDRCGADIRGCGWGVAWQRSR
jgi:hypothetical protein